MVPVYLFCQHTLRGALVYSRTAKKNERYCIRYCFSIVQVAAAVSNNTDLPSPCRLIVYQH